MLSRLHSKHKGNTMSQAQINHRRRMIEGAHRYASAMRSDPFAFNRAMSHINNGVCSPTDKGADSFYDAKLLPIQVKLPHDRKFSNGDNRYVKVEYVDVVVPCA
jgi:hypothetical protein